MKRIILGAMAAAALLACSKEQVIEKNRANDEITFSVVAENQTKAADVYCNNNLPAAFYVYANYDDKTYIDGDLIEKQTDGSWKNTSGVRYWPTGNVTFYAHVNAENNFTWVSGQAPTIVDYTVPTEVDKQKDLLYAVKTANRETVALNFRHALSQVVFNAKNTNPNLYVEISGVKICNLGNKNTFTYTTSNTDDTIINHDGTDETTTTGAWGNWNNLTEGDTDYPVTFQIVEVPYDTEDPVKELTSTNDTGKEFSSNAMILLPQNTTAWAPTADGNGIPAEQKGTYFLVNCKICNVAGSTYNSETDVVLWNDEAAIPVAVNWEQGKKYIYTFVFGDGNGGYDPTPTPDPDDPTPDPEPVLLPIDFTVTVDDFVPVVVTPDIEMEY